MNIIQKFLRENNLKLTVGVRNTTIVTIIGYAQYLKLSKDELIEMLSDEDKKDPFIEEEINRIWDYCEINGYEHYWTDTRHGVWNTCINIL